jgi:uncharacterized protein
MGDRVIFHLAIPINDISLAKNFYVEGLGCSIGRENSQAAIFNFYGHQLVAHVTEEKLVPQQSIYPRHFGIVFKLKSEWEATLFRAKERQLTFHQQPKLRFPGKLTEHHTFFLEDPFYNFLEFKYYLHQETIFGKNELEAIGDR